jgi:hypothetical protein
VKLLISALPPSSRVQPSGASIAILLSYSRGFRLSARQ